MILTSTIIIISGALTFAASSLIYKTIGFDKSESEDKALDTSLIVVSALSLSFLISNGKISKPNQNI